MLYSRENLFININQPPSTYRSYGKKKFDNKQKMLSFLYRNYNQLIDIFSLFVCYMQILRADLCKFVLMLKN